MNDKPRARIAFILVTLLLDTLGIGVIIPVLPRLVLSRQVGPSEQGELQGSLASLQSAAAIAGPLLGTALFARFAPVTARPHVPGAPFFAAAGLNAVGLGLALPLFARTPATSTTEAGA